MSAPQAERQSTGRPPTERPPTERLKECARRAAVAAEAVETIAGMIDQLQQTAGNFGAAVDVRIEGEAITGRVVIGIDLAGISIRRGVTVAATPAPIPAPIPTISEAETVVTFCHRPAASETMAAPAPAPSPTVEEFADTLRRHVHGTRNLGAPWSDDDDLQLLAKDESGLSMRELAARLGRTEPSCWTRLRKLRTGARAEPREKATPEPLTELRAKRTADQTADQIGELSRADLRVAERLRALPAAHGWSAARDLQLVEALTSGSKLPAVSKTLNLPSIDCIGRYRMLCPTGGFEEQVQVLRVLRRIVNEETG